MGHVGSKTRSLYQSLCTLLVRIFIWMKCQMNSEVGYVGSKTRSLSQILEKPCVCSERRAFQSDYYETWSECWS